MRELVKERQFCGAEWSGRTKNLCTKNIDVEKAINYNLETQTQHTFAVWSHRFIYDVCEAGA